MASIALFGVVLLAGHNALDGIDPASFGALKPLWIILHQPGILFTNGTSTVLVSYVLIPWVGVTALGYVLGAAGVSSRHTLALVNRGGASAAEVLALAEQISAAVDARFGIQLEMEPVMVGF